MAEHETGSQEKQEVVGQKHLLRQNESQPLFDHFHCWEPGTFSIGETPFWPRLDEHTELLKLAKSDKQRAGLVLQLQQTYGNRYVQRLVESVQIQSKPMLNSTKSVYKQKVNRIADGGTKATISLIKPLFNEEQEPKVQMQPTFFIQRQEVEEQEPQMQSASKEAEYYEKVAEIIKATLDAYRQVKIWVPPVEDYVTVKAAYWTQARSKKETKSTLAKRHEEAVKVVIAKGEKLKRAEVGKATPDEFQEYIQTAVNQVSDYVEKDKKPPQGLPKPGKNKEKWEINIQKWIKYHQIGIDCSGFVYAALLQVEKEMGLDFLPEWKLRPGEEALVSSKTTPEAERVKRPADLKSGDMMYHATDHIRIIMNIEKSTDPSVNKVVKSSGKLSEKEKGLPNWIVFTTAESSGSKKGPAEKTFAFLADVENFQKGNKAMKQLSDSAWKKAKDYDKECKYYRRIPMPESATLAQ